MAHTAFDTPQAQKIRRSVFGARRSWLKRVKQQENEILTVFQKATEFIDSEIKRLGDGAAPLRLIRMKASLARQATELQKEFAAGLKTAVRDGAEAGLGATIESLAGSLPAGFEFELGASAFSSVNRKAVTAILSRRLDGLALSSRIWNLTEAMNANVMRELALGAALGRSGEKVASRLRRGMAFGTKTLKATGARGAGVYRHAFDNYLRITRTESARAYWETTRRYGEGRPWAQFLQWTLSSAHAAIGVDVCDVFASQNLYGAGPGVYPRLQYPTTAHPHDLCTPIVYPDLQLIVTGKPSIAATRNQQQGPEWIHEQAFAKWDSLAKQAGKAKQPIGQFLKSIVGNPLPGGGTAPAARAS